MKIAICDDDLTFTGYLENEIMQECNKMGLKTKIEVFFDGYTLLENIKSGYRYEMIFIDIKMKQTNGIDAVRSIREIDRVVLIIYVSGYEQYLKELFELDTFRFLSKPLDKEKFHRYFREACSRINNLDSFYQYTFNKDVYHVPIRDIVYFESDKRMIIVNMADGSKKQFYGKLNDVEKSLLDCRNIFLRTHQSFLVNYNYITKIRFSSVIVSIHGEEFKIKISKDRQKRIREQWYFIYENKLTDYDDI